MIAGPAIVLALATIGAARVIRLAETDPAAY